MRGLASKITKSVALTGLLMMAATASAEINPFKKTKNYIFDDSIKWYEKKGTAMKSGSVPDGSDINYYHLNVSKSRLLLRLSKNDPSGDLQNTRILDALAITDVSVDGSRLPVFDWCLSNQQSPGRKLKQNAVVVNDTCVNAGGGGDFIIQLDERTHHTIMNASEMEFVIEPYGRAVRLVFDLSGFAPIMGELLKPPAPVAPAPAPAPVKTPEKPRVIAKPVPKPSAPVAPVVKPKPKPKPKPVKMCTAQPPADLQADIKAVVYPCENVARKAAAESQIKSAVEAKRQEQAKAAAMARQEEMAKQKEVKDSKRAEEWDRKQDAMWISRCQRHWKKGRSPCYCEKYLDQAPAGVKNTCGS